MAMKNFTIILLLSFTCVAMLVSNGYAEGAPLLEDIVANVLRTSISSKAYQVNVNQTISKPSLLESSEQRSTKNVVSRPIQTQSTFKMLYEPAKGVSAKKLELGKKNGVKTPRQYSQTPPTDTSQSETAVHITFDIQKLIKDVQKMTDATRKPEVLNGRQHYKVAGSLDNGPAYTLWIDAKLWNITQFTMDILGRRFSETTLEYSQYNNTWLPSTIVIKHSYDGTIVTQNFEDYQFIE